MKKNFHASSLKIYFLKMNKIIKKNVLTAEIFRRPAGTK